MKPRILDLFAGCGGLSIGFKNAGFNIAAAIDNDATALKTLSRNDPDTLTFQEDLGAIDVKKFLKNHQIGKIDAVIGGPPCQGFSISGKRDIDDPRNGLYRPFFSFVKELRPTFFLMENVPNLIGMGKGQYRDQIIELFNSIGYAVNYKILNASQFGVPQNRRRVFFVGTRGKQNPFIFPEGNYGSPQKPLISTFDAISDLPENSLDDGSAHPSQPLSDYQRFMRKKSSSVFNHQVSEHADKTIKIISLVPDGGNYKDLPKSLQATRRVNIAWTRFSSSKPSPTIDTGHRHHFHYQFNRVPTVREAARIQSFPDNYIFEGAKTSQYRQVGNAVPPILAASIARELKKQLL